MHFLFKDKDSYKVNESLLHSYGCYSISNYFEIHDNGDISLCCFTWLPKIFGNVLTDTPQQVYNNIDRFKLIYDMSEGNFTECTDHCPHINSFLSGQHDDTSFIVDLRQLRQVKQQKPIIVNFSYDRSCNLQCPSCRNELIIFKQGENSKLEKLHDAAKSFVNYLLEKNHKVVIKITGSGDAFASPTYWNYLKELSTNANKNLGLRLHTNGLLMTAERLKEIEPLWEHIEHINISIDAATSETYKVVRKSESFDKLKHNLHILDELIDTGKFTRLVTAMTNFTVQKDNFREIKDFLSWQFGYRNIKDVYFSMVEKWGHISDDDYKNKFWLSEDEFVELQEIISDPLFNDKRVMLGNLNMVRN